MADKKEQKNEVNNDYIQDLLNKLKVSLDNYDNENTTKSNEEADSIDEISIKLDELSTEGFERSEELSQEAASQSEFTQDEQEEPDGGEDLNEVTDVAEISEVKELSQAQIEQTQDIGISTAAEQDEEAVEDDIILSDEMEQISLDIEEEAPVENSLPTIEAREPSNVELPPSYTEEKCDETTVQAIQKVEDTEEDYSLEDDLPWEVAKKEAEEEGFEIEELDADDTVDINTLMIKSAKVRVRKYKIKLVSRKPDKIAPIEMMPKIEQLPETREDFLGAEVDYNDTNDNYTDVLEMVNKYENEKTVKSSHEEKVTPVSIEEEPTKELELDFDNAPTMPFAAVSKNDTSYKGVQTTNESEEYPEFDDLDTPKAPSPECDISEYSIHEFSYDGVEDSSNTTNYNYPNEVSRIKSEYKKSVRIEKIKIISIAILAFLLLLLENAIIVNVNVAQLLNIDSNPAMYALLDLQIFIIAAALSYYELFCGAKSIFDKKISAESFCVCATLFVVLFNIVICIANEYTSMYSFAAAMILLACHISKYIELCSQRDTFDSYSSQGDKLVAEVVKNQDIAYSLKERFSKIETLKVMRIKKVGYVNGYLDRLSKKSNDTRLNTVILAACVSISLACGVMALIIRDFSLVVFMSALVSTFVFSVAFSIFYSHVLPMYFVEKNAIKEHCAIVGEYSVGEYTGIDFVSFEDVEAFPTRKAKIKGIKIFGTDRPDDILYNMSGIFATVGGPLDGIFRVSVSDLGMSNDVKVLSVSSNGLRALVDGRELLVGKGDYMEKNGVTLFYDSDDEAQIEEGNVSIMFLAENGELSAKFYVEYNISSRFLANVKKLKSYGVRSVIRTYDPNIDEKLIEKLITLDDTISVVKKMPENVNDYAQLCIDSGLVTGESSRDIIKMIFSCFNAKKAIKASKIAMTVGIVIGMICAVSSVAMSLSFPSVTMALVSILTLVPLIVISKFIIK